MDFICFHVHFTSIVFTYETKPNCVVNVKGMNVVAEVYEKKGLLTICYSFRFRFIFCAFLLLLLLIYLVCFSLTPFEMFTFQKNQPFFRIFVFVILGAMPFGWLSPLLYFDICSFCLRFATIANIPFPHHFDFNLKHTHVSYFRFYPFFNILHFKFIYTEVVLVVASVFLHDFEI